MRLDSAAAFDVLYITHSLQRTAGGLMPAELHLFGYLACVLWLYTGRTAHGWGYAFLGTELGAPFSPAMDVAVTELTARGFLGPAGERLRMSSVAEDRLQPLRSLELNRDRTECLDAACASTSAFSLGMIGGALAQDPELQRARAVPLTRQLLERPARAVLYRHFEALKKNLPRTELDLRVPAVVWLGALHSLGRNLES